MILSKQTKRNFWNEYILLLLIHLVKEVYVQEKRSSKLRSSKYIKNSRNVYVKNHA